LVEQRFERAGIAVRQHWDFLYASYLSASWIELSLTLIINFLIY